MRRYIHGVRPAAPEAFLRLQTMPGEQAQVDWGHFGKIQVGSAKRALSCFVLVLSWSRAIYARFALDQTLESFLRGHVLGFAALGGVPREILYDNLKSVVLERAGDHIRFHPRILDLAGHCHFAPKPCTPYRGNENGKVERQIQYLRHSFFAARRFSSVDDLNAQLARWIVDVAHTRRAPGHADGRTVGELLSDEQPRLLPLPADAMECDRVVALSSGKTPYVRFDLNDYSIPHTLVRRPLTLVASEDTVRIVDGQEVVARHVRSYDRGKTIEDPAHIAALARDKRRAHDLRGRDLLRSVCKHADELLDKLALRGEHIGGHTVRLTQLLRPASTRNAVDVRQMMYAYSMKGTLESAQLTLSLPRPKVKRRRKPGRKRAADSKDPVHRVRESLRPGNAVHTILRVKADVGRLRRGPVLEALRRALVVVGVKADFRVVHFSIQHNHVHFLVEATGASALSKGMQAVAVSAARAINRVMRRRGKVFAYRFHSTVIRSPRQARSCLAYVLNNWRRHCEDERSLEARHCPVDPYSSAPSFSGWNQALNLAALPGWGGFTPIPGAAPTTWLLREGWRRAGDPLDMWTTPGPPH